MTSSATARRASALPEQQGFVRHARELHRRADGALKLRFWADIHHQHSIRFLYSEFSTSNGTTHST